VPGTDPFGSINSIENDDLLRIVNEDGARHVPGT
jgi:hypothetical protein